MTAIKICYFVTHDKYMQFVNLFCDTWQIQGESPPSQSPFAAQVGSPQKASNFVDAVVQVGPPSLKPSQDACKLQMLRTELAQKDMQKDMDIMGLSPLAVIMITVFRKVFPHEIWNILNMLEEKTFQIHWFLESLDLWPGQQLLTTQRDLDDRISVLNKCGYELKKTLQELKEEKERSAELAKVVKMLDNQWVGVTADKEWSIAMQCTLGKKCLAWLLQCNALWGLRCLSYQGYTWKSSTIWHAWALFVRPVEDSSGADLFFAMKHGKIQSQETTISSQLTLTCSLLKGCLENKYPAKSHFPGLDHLLLICQWLCSRLSKLNVRWITVSFDLHTSALWIVLWVLNWMKCCIPPKSCQVTLLYDTTRLFLWIWGKKALAVTYQVSVS